MAHVRYRYKGQFISESNAVRLSRLKGPAKSVTSERVAVHSNKTVKFVRGFVKPAEIQRGAKPLPRPVTPPLPAPPPAAVPPPPPAPAERPRRVPKETPEEKFESALEDFEASAEDAGDTPDPEEAGDLHDKFDNVRAAYEDLEEPTDDQTDDFDRATDLWSDIAPFEGDPWDRELFGFEMEDNEDALLDEFETLDIDDDSEYPKK